MVNSTRGQGGTQGRNGGAFSVASSDVNRFKGGCGEEEFIEGFLRVGEAQCHPLFFGALEPIPQRVGGHHVRRCSPFTIASFVRSSA